MSAQETRDSIIREMAKIRRIMTTPKTRGEICYWDGKQAGLEFALAALLTRRPTKKAKAGR